MRGTSSPMPVDVEEQAPADVLPKDVAVRRRDRLGVVMSEESAAKVRADPGAGEGWTFRRSHWETCPSAREHRVNPNQGSLL